MALNNSPVVAHCPKCKATGPDNFVIQDRVTLKQPDPESFPNVYNAVSSKRVYACAYCGHVMKEV